VCSYVLTDHCNDFNTELIGEEIYDEFDTDGARHGEVTSYVPPQSNSPTIHVAPSLMRKGSAPELSSRYETSSVAHSPPQPARRPASASGTPVLRPIAIPALRGLSFLTGRSRSMPPIPRDNKRSSSARPSAPKASDEKQKQSAPTIGYIHADGKPSEPLSTLSVDVPAMPAPAYLPLPVLVQPSPDIPINDTARVRPGAIAVSHSSSPTPSLSEALLRARRPATPHTPGASQPKGTRFKSNITGVADHVLRLGEQYQQQQAQSQTSGDPKGENRDEMTDKNGSGGACDGVEMQEEA
jgi:metal transporter CNNM